MKKLSTKLAAASAMLAMAFGLAACNKAGAPAGATQAAAGQSAAPAGFKNTDLTGLSYARDFALTDHTGKPRTLADFKGKVVLMFFGYTQCPDVCPTTLTELAQVMKELGPKADDVQVLFVTVDPERDTQALLAQYVPSFDKRFIGLYGDAKATAAVAKEFKVFYAKVEGREKGEYSMDHTSGSYVFDRTGKIRLFVRHGQGSAPITHDLLELLK